MTETSSPIVESTDNQPPPQERSVKDILYQVFNAIGLGIKKTVAFIIYVLGIIDRLCLWTASAVGVFKPNPRAPRIEEYLSTILPYNPRLPRIQLILLFSAILLIHIFAPPMVGLMFLLLGLWLVLSISRAWAYTDNLRNLVAKKVGFTDPPKYIPPPKEGIAPGPQNIKHLTQWLHCFPDLLLTAILSAALLLLLQPMVCQRLHQTLGMFPTENIASFGEWFAFVWTRTYVRFLPEVVGMLGIELKPIPRGGLGGLIVLLVMRLLILYILIQGIRRILDIRQNVGDALRAVTIDPAIPALIGFRAVTPLMARYREEGVSLAEKTSIIRALGVLVETGGLDDHRREEVYELLEEAISMDPGSENQDEVEALQVEAAVTLAKLRSAHSVLTLGKLLGADKSTLVQRKASETLGGLRDRDDNGEPTQAQPDTLSRHAAGALIGRLRQLREGEKEQKPNQDVLKQVVEAIGLLLEGEESTQLPQMAREWILREPVLLRHEYIRVRNRAVTTLGRLGNPEDGGPILQMLKDPVNANNPQLRTAGGEALGRLKLTDPQQRSSVVQHLLEVLRDSKENESVRFGYGRGLARLQESQALDTIYGMLEQAANDKKSAAKRELMGILSLYGEEEWDNGEAILDKAERDRAALASDEEGEEESESR